LPQGRMGTTDTSAALRIRQLKAKAIRTGTPNLRDASDVTEILGVCCPPSDFRATYTNTSGPCPGQGQVSGFITLYFPVEISEMTSVTAIGPGGSQDASGFFTGASYPASVINSVPIQRNCDPSDVTIELIIVTPQGTFTGTFTIPAGF
jgi:hypothetical protein